MKRTLEFGFFVFRRRRAVGGRLAWPVEQQAETAVYRKVTGKRSITTGVARCPLGEQKAKGTMA